jgi:hypothetical protein
MVQPKYNPQEALERVKLMMNYDLSKTSTENKKVIEEQTEEKNSFSCVKNYFRSKNVRFTVDNYATRKIGRFLLAFVSTTYTYPFKDETWVFRDDKSSPPYEWSLMVTDDTTKEDDDVYVGRGSFGTGKWKCDGNNNFIITKDDGTIYKSSSSNVNQSAAPSLQDRNKEIGVSLD